MRPPSVALVLATVAVVLFSALAAPAHALLRPNFNSVFYPTWAGDANHNGLDDRLDAAIASGATGHALVFVHYAYHPTASEVAALRALGATQTYVFQNVDDVQADVPYSSLLAARGQAGVVAIEEYEPPSPDLDTSARTLRVREAPGLPVLDGIDHGFAVREDLGYDGTGMVIAVLDTGVDNTHPALDDLDDDPATIDPKIVTRVDPVQGLLVGGLFAPHDDPTGGDTYAPVGCVDPADHFGHGTAVAGVALGTGDASGANVGIAPKARLVDLGLDIVWRYNGGTRKQTLYYTGAAVALDWAASFNRGATCFGDPGADRIDVLTMSASGGDLVRPDSTLSRLVNEVVRAGITMTGSAGNTGSGAESIRDAADGAILVGNVADQGTILRDDDVIETTSSRGPRVGDGDLDATDELRPDVAAPGTGVVSTAAAASGGGWQPFGGTSAATPHVAGIAALMLQANPALRPVSPGPASDPVTYQRMGDAGVVPVRDLLQQTAQAKTSASPAPQSSAVGRWGHAWNNAWGYGEADAYAAVLAAEAVG